LPPLSIDTYHPDNAERAIDYGVAVINDITAGTGAAAVHGTPLPAEAGTMFRVAARHGAALCLMHLPAPPRTMQQKPHYRDVVREVFDGLRLARDAAIEAGVAPD